MEMEVRDMEMEVLQKIMVFVENYLRTAPSYCLYTCHHTILYTCHRTTCIPATILLVGSLCSISPIQTCTHANQSNLNTSDFAELSAPLLYDMFKAHTDFPLHLAIQHLREDVVFLFLIEYNAQVCLSLSVSHSLSAD